MFHKFQSNSLTTKHKNLIKQLFQLEFPNHCPRTVCHYIIKNRQTLAYFFWRCGSVLHSLVQCVFPTLTRTNKKNKTKTPHINTQNLFLSLNISLRHTQLSPRVFFFPLCREAFFSSTLSHAFIPFNLFSVTKQNLLIFCKAPNESLYAHSVPFSPLCWSLSHTHTQIHTHTQSSAI